MSLWCFGGRGMSSEDSHPPNMHTNTTDDDDDDDDQWPLLPEKELRAYGKGNGYWKDYFSKGKAIPPMVRIGCV